MRTRASRTAPHADSHAAPDVDGGPIGSGQGQNATPYADALVAFADRSWERLGVPGHQAHATSQPGLAEFVGGRVMALDIPPLTEGIDHCHGEGPTPLHQSAALAAAAFGARRTWFLTNGASQGNLVSCLALRGLGTELVVQRSVHSSVIDGLALAGLDAHFVIPSVDTELGISHGVTPAALAAQLAANPGAAAAYVVTPSYFGAVADVKGLADVAHSHGVPLVVDEAWGAHFGFHPQLPTNALRLGADLVISSTHKLAGSLTQSAMLHLGDGEWADRLEPLIERAFRSMQSTSTSAVLLASLDLARRQLAVQGRDMISASIEAADKLRSRIAVEGRFRDPSAQMLAFDDVVALDPLHVVIDTRSGGVSGHQARATLFQDHDIQLEMSTDSVVVAIIGAGAVPDVDRVADALHSLPHEDGAGHHWIELPSPGPRSSSVRDAYFAATEIVGADSAVGRVSADAVAAYPPGIPNLLPGEVITSEAVTFLQETVEAPFGYVRGGIDKHMTSFRVVSR
ncbi:MAG TPA: aminotransferase class V-fold PLP-dependent enzyme [Actinomycetes bacterium]|nr:aminotransferase class V-fold PLP-dependent enzyme [Actinomycetes bacterium]